MVYELHVGTMTPEGTFAALDRELAELARLGVTAIELMPVAQCPGQRNWGYDGVDLFAPVHRLRAPGRPAPARRCRPRRRAGVHPGRRLQPLRAGGRLQGVYRDEYFSEPPSDAWGAALNWDGPGSEWVRDYAIDNACHWITEYHIDGLRLDATHAIVDDSPVHLVQELAGTRSQGGRRRDRSSIYRRGWPPRHRPRPPGCRGRRRHATASGRTISTTRCACC